LIFIKKIVIFANPDISQGALYNYLIFLVLCQSLLLAGRPMMVYLLVDKD